MIHCTCTNVSCEWVFCLHSPSVVGKSISRPTETGPISEKFHEWSDREECQEFQLLVVQWLLSHFVDEDDGDEGDRFPPRWFIACSILDRIVVFFNSFELLFFSLSFRRSMSGAALVILLGDIAGYRHDIVVALVDLLFIPGHS